jgi:hypothetical protein
LIRRRKVIDRLPDCAFWYVKSRSDLTEWCLGVCCGLEYFNSTLPINFWHTLLTPPSNHSEHCLLHLLGKNILYYPLVCWPPGLSVANRHEVA